MRYLLATQHKSGTHLLAEILTQLGLHNTHVHILPWDRCTYYDPNDIETGREKPQKFFRRELTKHTLAKVQDEQFLQSHLPPSRHLLNMLEGFRVIYLTRDLDSRLKSWDYWVKNIRPSRATSKFPYDFEIENWNKVTELRTYGVTYDELKIPGEIDKLQQFLFGAVTFDSEEAIDKALATRTLTSR